MGSRRTDTRGNESGDDSGAGFLLYCRLCMLARNTKQLPDHHPGGIDKMSFTGDLEHLPIVDVIQLMNSSRKSGILSVKGKKGESQLVFKDGYIVSANHLNNSVRIGQIIVDMGLISGEQLEHGLQKQQQDGSDRKPLIITLIELGLTREEDAYKGLQKLIEITLVEILTWKTGKFTLEALSHSIACDFRYYPEKMDHEVNLNTQSILMDALRIFDEKMRDGLLTEETPDEPDFDAAFAELLSEDDLGLAEIDHISAQLPKAFTGITPFDPVRAQQDKIRKLAPELPAAGVEKLAAFLDKHAVDPNGAGVVHNKQGLLVVISSDQLLIHALETVLAGSTLQVTAVRSGHEFAETMTAAARNGKRGFLLFDTPLAAAADDFRALLGGIRQQARQYMPAMIAIQLAAPREFGFTLEAYRAGIRAVIPRPLPGNTAATFPDDLIALLDTLPLYLQSCQPA